MARSRTKQVEVRMYRARLGDCFLLTFHDGQSRSRILVDCGTFVGVAGSAQLMRDIAQDIATHTDGELDVLVITHEHWDHLSGFIYAHNEFADQRFKVNQVWLGWTEDPNDPEAEELRQGRRQALDGLRSLWQGLNAQDSAAPWAADVGCRDTVGMILGFVGPAQDGDLAGEFAAASLPLPADGGPASGAAVMELARDWPGARTRYFSPGEDPIDVPGIGGVRVYVLGPPRRRDLLFRSDPSASEAEVYHLAAEGGHEAAFLAALRFGSAKDVREAAERMPFGPEYRRTEQQARRYRNLQQYYDKEPDRRIETDWLATAERLALKLDNDTNNTCLALAIELVDSGQVLLFPGDAQVGNWLGWHLHRWDVPVGAGTRTVTTKDLLSRTVLYKVGHHGSHNATLRDKGLEMMTSGDLVAMIPVDEDFARGKKHWEMPFGPLLERLEQKTRRRILRTDPRWEGLPDAKPTGVGLSQTQWDQFRAAVTCHDLYVQYTIET